jgi:metallo-beta-lactamase family protein
VGKRGRVNATSKRPDNVSSSNSANVELEFHGAAGEVTGSMHLIHMPQGSFALDCGLFQGRRTEAMERNRRFPFAPRDLAGVLLSHAHIDHSGNLPGLAKAGFRGPIHATSATCDLCAIMLADSAHIQEEDAEFWNTRRAGGPHERIQPLYTTRDAEQASRLCRPAPYNQPMDFAPEASATFLEAGHILGSSAILVELRQPRPLRVLYTGDLGRFSVPILKDPAEPFPPADYLITESTYANRKHPPASDMKADLVRIIRQTCQAGGKVVIPSFSVGRTQTVVYYLSQAFDEGLLEDIPVYVDSPLSAGVTEVFQKHTELYDEEARRFWKRRGDVFGLGKVRFVASTEESKALNERKDPMVVLASSGMCEAGRILHHLKHCVENEANTVVIVGFQAQHTLGRRIVERRPEIKIFGRLYKLLCRVEVLNGFSAHADRDDFRRLLAPLARGLKGAFVVHGEADALAAMKELLESAGCPSVHAPAPGEKFRL